MGGVKDKIMRAFKRNTADDYNRPIHVNNVFGGGKKLRYIKIKNHLKTK